MRVDCGGGDLTPLPAPWRILHEFPVRSARRCSVIVAEPPTAHTARLPDARGEYTARLERACRDKERLEQRERWLRLALVVTVRVTVVPLVFVIGLIHPAWLIVPAVPFVALLLWQRRVRRALHLSGQRIDWYRRG